jgi:hypothetical protein
MNIPIVDDKFSVELKLILSPESDEILLRLMELNTGKCHAWLRISFDADFELAHKSRTQILT